MDETIIYLLELSAKIQKIESLIDQLQSELAFNRDDIQDPASKVLDLMGFPQEGDENDPEGFSRDYFYEIIFEGEQDGESAETILGKLKDALKDMKKYRGWD